MLISLASTIVASAGRPVTADLCRGGLWQFHIFPLVHLVKHVMFWGIPQQPATNCLPDQAGLPCTHCVHQDCSLTLDSAALQVWDYTHDSKQHAQLLKGPAPLVWESKSSLCHQWQQLTGQGPVWRAFRLSRAVPSGGHACPMQQLNVPGSRVVWTLCCSALTMLHSAPAHHSRAFAAGCVCGDCVKRPWG